MNQTPPYPEIIFGIVGPLGLDMEMVETMLSACLEDVGYFPQRVKLTDALRALRVPETYKFGEVFTTGFGRNSFPEPIARIVGRHAARENVI